MKSIEPLSEAVYSPLRSSMILFDLTTIVEELVYNSLDAGAKKVSVYVDVSSCFVKVADDGSGLTREGLVLFGEKSATSKLQNFDDATASSRNFGFRGEALGSISDVSLLEVVTKAHGTPNGFRKVMKGCKCLYLGVDDGRQDAGTTVTVRDLFYNQPVRRKQMQKSPKKILHSVKKCVLRIALVHPVVSFEIVDIDSEEELLHTHPSSPLSLMMRFFGIEVSSSLYEVNLSEGALKFSGYISGPCGTSFLEAFQYVYINSRFIHKGRIHKFLNHIASRFNCDDLCEPEAGGQDVKGSRPQASPSYILNLSCPRCWYDLAFEPLKTSVEFKDWFPILNFIEKAITHIWNEKKAHGQRHVQKEGSNNLPGEVFSGTDISANSEIAKPSFETRSHQDLLGPYSAPKEFLKDNCDHIFQWKDDRIPFEEWHQNSADLEGQQIEMDFVHQPYSFQPMDVGLAKCTSSAKQETDKHLWPSDYLSEEDFCSNKRFAAAERLCDYKEGHTLDLRRETQFPGVNVKTSNVLRGSELIGDVIDFDIDVEEGKYLRKPFLKKCSSKGLLSDVALFLRDKKADYKWDGSGTKRKRLNYDDLDDVVEAFGDFERFSYGSTLMQDVVASSDSSSRTRTNFDLHADAAFPSRDLLQSFPFNGSCFPVRDNYSPATVSQGGNCGYYQSNLEPCSLTSDLRHEPTTWGINNYTCQDACERNSRFGPIDVCLPDGKHDSVFSSDIRLTPHGRKFYSNCTNSTSEFELLGVHESVNGTLRQAGDLDDPFSPRCRDTLIRVRDQYCLNSYAVHNTEHSVVFSHPLNLDKHEIQNVDLRFQHCGQTNVPKERARSHSAPPLYRGKKRYFAFNSHQPVEAGGSSAQTTLQENSELGCPGQSPAEPSFIKRRPAKTLMRSIIPHVDEIPKGHETKFPHSCHVDSDKDLTLWSDQEIVDSGVKWRFGMPPTATNNKAENSYKNCSVLDISSEILPFAADSLVPSNINKGWLEDAKVLQQLDKKFIPVIASGTLAIIDQHAADERIRLEELRQKVLCGELRTITYLDAEQELALPEINYQLMHKYAQQLQNWGWITNNHSCSSSSFAKNLDLLHMPPTAVKLLAVPCILGVNLSDLDLQEFLQQLSDTDGSSTIPPSVVRVLNSKACRGAVMFGDSLLLSECSLIVEELKRTSLCFQCAHGRPTTVPLVTLDALHKQIAELRTDVGSNKSWHGLWRHAPTLQRSARRLNTAKRPA